MAPTQLDSIDGLGDVTAAQYVSTTTAPVAQPAAAAAPMVSAAPATAQPSAEVAAPVAEAAAEAPVSTAMTNRQDPRFARYFKMVDMGVPLQAVKGKFAVETGCDPSIMEYVPAAWSGVAACSLLCCE